LVCCAHIVDMANDNGVDVPDFVVDANIKAEEHNEMVRTRTATITRHENFLNDFELMIHHTAHRVMHKSSRKVGIFHYETGHPELISHTYGTNVPESIVDYSDVLQFKLNQAGVHDTTTCEVRVDPRAISKIYNWDGQTHCPRTDCFKLDAYL
jgi:hypothetical protein